MSDIRQSDCLIGLPTVGEPVAHSGPCRSRPRRMNVKPCILLLLVLLLGGSASYAAAASGTRASEQGTGSSLAAHDGVGSPSCNDLRDAETILAEHEVRLLDQLASQTAVPAEREAWKGDLVRTKAFLEDVDRALEAARCPPPSRGS